MKVNKETASEAFILKLSDTVRQVVVVVIKSLKSARIKAVITAITSGQSRCFIA